jgi:hypothetical protein
LPIGSRDAFAPKFAEPPNKGVALDRAGVTVFRDITFLAAGPASERSRYAPRAEFPMLEALDSVNWSELGHAYGPAEDVPDLIRALLSDDAKKREDARWHLWGNIIHQGTVYAATAHAVPFFLELLDSPTVQDKPHLLVLVTSLACGNSYLDAHKDLFEDVPAMREKMEQPEWDEQLHEELGWVKAAHLAVVKGWQVYVRRLSDTDPSTRAAAAYALAVCGQHAAAVVPPLRQQLASEADDGVKASVLICLGCIGGGDCGPLFEEWLKKRTHPVVKAAAALSLARVCRERTLPEAVEVLADCLQNPTPVDALYLQLPWSSGESIVSAAGQALSQLGLASAGAIVPRIAQGLKNLRKQDTGSITVVGTLLALAFVPQKEPRSAADLSEIQRTVLTQLVESDRAWDWGNVSFVLRQFGLPSDRKEMAEFVGLPTEGLGEGITKRCT